jgi:hypothetical protein
MDSNIKVVMNFSSNSAHKPIEEIGNGVSNAKVVPIRDKGK